MRARVRKLASTVLLSALFLGILSCRAPGAEDAGLEALIREGNEYLTKQQETTWREFRLEDYERYDWSQETGEIVFSNAGVPQVIARFQVVGDVSGTSKTWLWSWANKSIDPKLAVGARKLRAYGEREGMRKLTKASWPADEKDGWCMTAIAAKLLHAKGGYRAPDAHGGALFMVLTDVRWAADRPSRQR